MDHDRHLRIKELLLAAFDIGSDQRASFLDRACGDDLPLWQEIESLIACDCGSIEAFLRQPAIDEVGASELIAEHDPDPKRPYCEGEQISNTTATTSKSGYGRYTIIEEIGEEEGLYREVLERRIEILGDTQTDGVDELFSVDFVRPAAIFADGFESGNLAAWTTSTH